MVQSLAMPRARYGLIIPSSNRMAEPHANRYTPAGVVPHTTRLRMTGKWFMPLGSLLPKVAEAAAMLADARCDPIVFHCTANSMADGVAGERRIVAAIHEATGVRATTTASATLAAFNELGIRRVVLVSPYTRSIHEHELHFMEEAGIEVVSERNLDLSGSDAYCAMTPDKWRETMIAMRNARADAYFASCANIRAIEALEGIEKELGKPVLTSNQLVIWQALRLAGIDDPVPGLGRLAAGPLTATAAGGQQSLRMGGTAR